jgi:cytochrome c-type biogenesis protein CcmH/NrfG
MSSQNGPGLPQPSPDQDRIAKAQFAKAQQVVATGQYDYAIKLLLTCCKLDPANLLYRQRLRLTEKAKYQNNMKGSSVGWLTTGPTRARVKAAMASRDYLKAIEVIETLLTKNPWDVAAQMDLARAAEALGHLDLAVWSLEQARQKSGTDVALNRALARLYEKRGNFNQAIVLWQMIKKAKPTDQEAQDKIKNLAANDTISRGQYEAATGVQGPKAAADGGDDEAEGAEAKPSPLLARRAQAPVQPVDRVAREAAPLKARIQADATNAGLYLQLAHVYRRAGDLNQAKAALQEGLGPTGNAFELTLEMADIDIEPFRRDLAHVEEKLKAHHDDPLLLKDRAALRKEITARELDVYRRKAERFPTEMSHRYNMGTRLLELGQVDEAIRELQTSRADPRHRWQSLLGLGKCFKARNNWRLAQRNFEESLQALPPGDSERRKEILFELATGCAGAGEYKQAVDLGHELANLDYGYQDIGRLLDEWQAKVAD